MTVEWFPQQHTVTGAADLVALVDSKLALGTGMVPVMAASVAVATSNATSGQLAEAKQIVLDDHAEAVSGMGVVPAQKEWIRTLEELRDRRLEALSLAGGRLTSVNHG